MKSFDARLLSALREAGVHLPASDLATLMGEPAALVRQGIAELGAAGFEIEDRPGLGYRLLAAPDRLIADDLCSRLGPCPLIREILVFEETGSTNDVAAQRGRQGAAPGLAIFAERQKAGRGRFGRKWESASHRGIWFSLLLRPNLPMVQWPRLTSWAAVALASAIENETGLKATIKWPNDVYVEGKKVAGILIESGLDENGQPFAVVGIGLNVNHEQEDFPEELLSRATSLRIAAGEVQDRSAVAVAIFRELNRYYPRIEADFPAIVAQASARSFLLGRWIQLQAGEGLIAGVAEELDADGHLLLRQSDGSLHRLTAGEVTVVGSQPAG